MAAVIVAATIFVTVGSSSATKTVSTTRTITISSMTNGSYGLIEEVIIQPETLNDICFLQNTNSTSTAYLTSAASSLSGAGSQTAGVTTTETLRAVTTITLYYNATMVSNGITCTLINPYYSTTQTSYCPPCV